MEDTWFSRDLPVLDAAVRLKEEYPDSIPMSENIARATGLPVSAVRLALGALSGEYVDTESGVAEDFMVMGVTPAARRAVGQWPTPENVAERLVGALEQAADRSGDEEQRSRLRRAADSLKGLGRDVLPEVIGNVITKGAMGL